MKKNSLVTALLFFVAIQAKIQAQPMFGIWKARQDLVPTYLDVRGSMVISKWQQIQPNAPSGSSDGFNWTGLDNDLKANTTSYTVLLVYIWSANTNVFPPLWMFKAPLGTGTLDYVDLLNCTAQNTCSGTCTSSGFYAPPFYDAGFKSNFKTMITKVRQRIADVVSGAAGVDNTTKLAYQKIISVQACMGSTGDYPDYKGYCVTGAAASTDFSAYFYEMSQYFDAAYSGSSIRVLHNPGNNNTAQINWVLGSNSPVNSPSHPWLKMGDVGHAYQLNGEKDYYNTIHVTNGEKLFVPLNSEYVRTRSEMANDVTGSGWWKAPNPADPINYYGYLDPNRPYRNMFALFGSALYFGLDMSNQVEELQNGTAGSNPYQKAFDFYNKYTDQKDPATATKAFCMLRDALDASNTTRFPEGTLYGTYTMATTNQLKDRFQKIQSNTTDQFSLKGAKLEDVDNAVGGALGNRGAHGINDVGDNIIETNFERYITQIAPDLNGNGLADEPLYTTCNSYWNVPTSDVNAFFGRNAKSIYSLNGSTAKAGMYFTISDNFLSTYQGNLKFTIWYLDKDNLNWTFRYKPIGATEATILTVPKGNTNSWKYYTVTVDASAFKNRNALAYKSDFSLYATTASPTVPKETIFSLIEIEKTGSPLQAKSMNTKNTADEFSISPNPASDHFTVAAKNKKIISSLAVYNQFGKLILLKKINNNSTVINRNEIGNAPGIYFVNIVVNGEILRKELKVL